MSFRFHPQARDDLFALYDFIAGDDAQAASSLIDRLYDACRFLGQNPRVGRLRPDLGEAALRTFVVGRYLIIYRATGNSIEIVYVAHGSRDVAALVAQEDR